MKILLTGSEGFIGSHLLEKLVKDGHTVKALIMYNFNDSIGWLSDIDKSVLKNIEIIKGDVRDNNLINSATKKIDCVMHLAALIGIPYSYTAVQSYIETNITGTLNILQNSLNNNVSKIICTSTSEVYGSGVVFPMKEEHRLNAQSPYAATKIAADQLSLSYFYSFGLPVTVLRPFNTYGPRQSNRAVIPTIINQMKLKNNIDLGALNTRRDFTYIDDTVDGFVKCLNAKNISGEVINLGTGYDISIKNLFNIIRKIVNPNSKIRIQEKRLRPNVSEVQRLLSSNKKAKKLLQWTPKYQNKEGLVKGLSNSIDWYLNEENLKKFTSNNYII